MLLRGQATKVQGVALFHQPDVVGTDGVFPNDEMAGELALKLLVGQHGTKLRGIDLVHGEVIGLVDRTVPKMGAVIGQLAQIFHIRQLLQGYIRTVYAYGAGLQIASGQ